MVCVQGFDLFFGECSRRQVKIPSLRTFIARASQIKVLVCNLYENVNGVDWCSFVEGGTPSDSTSGPEMKPLTVAARYAGEVVDRATHQVAVAVPSARRSRLHTHTSTTW